MADSETQAADIAKIDTPRLMICGTGCGVGVSTLVLGILVAFNRRRLAVAAAKIGRSALDTLHFRRITERLSHTLDPWLLSRENIIESVARLTTGAELVIVEAELGLLDSRDSDLSISSDADAASMLNMPVVLVFEAGGYSESIKALIKGFVDSSSEARVVGVIANKVESEEQDSRLRQSIEELNGPIYLGGVPRREVKDLAVFASEPGQEGLLTRAKLVSLGDLVESTLDLAALRRCGSQAGVLKVPNKALKSLPRSCRIAVADDQAFDLTVQDNLDLLRRFGAEIVPFSPIADGKLPREVSGMYLPGGSIEPYMCELQSNERMRKSIREFVRSGGALYAEGCSLAYLCQTAVMSNGDSFEMVGLIPGAAVSALQDQIAFGPQYYEVFVHEENVLMDGFTQLRGVREVRWAVRLERQVRCCFRLRQRVVPGKEDSEADYVILDGFAPYQHMIASSVQIHWGSDIRLAEKFVRSAKLSKEKQA